MANNKANVTTGKPKVGGAIYRAPLGTTVPTTADATLDEAFVAMGYISADGVTNAISNSSSNITAWGGDIVLIADGEKSDTMQFTMLETLNKVVLAAVNGGDNVTGDLDAGMTVEVDPGLQEEAIWVIDTIGRGKVGHRIVMPDAQIITRADVVYKDGAAVGFGVTLNCFPDANGKTHKEYFKKIASGT